jgi:predicted transcriptional regulator
MEVLKALWETGPSTVREVEAELVRRGHRWAYTTIQTLLQRLQTKDLVTTNKESTPHVYAPLVSRERLLARRLKELALNMCDGMTAPLARAMVSEEHFSREEIDHFRSLLDEKDSK